MEEQFPYEEGYRITDYKDFKFKENTEPHVRVVPTCECDKIDVTLNPTSSKVLVNTVICLIIINFHIVSFID